MRVRPVEPADREEWLRLRRALYPDADAVDLAAEIDAFFGGLKCCQSLVPSAVSVTARPEGGLAGFLEVSVRNYAEGCTGILRAPAVDSSPFARSSLLVFRPS